VTETVFSETGMLVRQRATPLEINEDKSPDFVGVGKVPPPTSPLSAQEAREFLNRVAAMPINQGTVQVLRFYAKEYYLIGAAVITRRFTNLDTNGNVKPHLDPNTGSPIVNYSIPSAGRT
jgi:hypothetical protein